MHVQVYTHECIHRSLRNMYYTNQQFGKIHNFNDNIAMKLLQDIEVVEKSQLL